MLAQRAGTGSGAVPEQFREAIRWVAEQLHPENQRLLASWPKTLRVEICGLGEILFCHATPRSDTEIFTRLTPEERFLRVFEGLNVPVVACGHTHMQFDRTIGGVRVVAAAVWQHRAANLGAIAACGITETARQEEKFINSEARDLEVSEKSLRAAAVPGGKWR